jgi:hypothetical protein
MSVTGLLGYGAAVYVAMGVCTALAFATAGIERALPQRTHFTVGARLVLLPGLAALWPYVLARWLGRR